jgi:menaquinone-9 beta-reductase
MSLTMHESENLVIGGGPAGAMLALRLAAPGRNVTLLEKERDAHHKVCGEFLSHEAVAYLRSAGMEPLALGAATIRTVRLAARNRLVEAALPFTAMSLSRRVLDEALLGRAAACGCNVQRGAFVESLGPGSSGWITQTRGGDRWHSPNVFLATGKHDLAAFRRKPSAQRDLIGFKLHLRLEPAQTAVLREAMELFLFPGGYGGLSLVENDIANLCFVVKRSMLSRAGGWNTLLALITRENRHVAERLRAAVRLWDRPLAIYPIPYGYLAQGPANLWRLGDQAAVIPSFTGDGISIALHSGVLAAQMFLHGKSAAEYHRALARQLRPGMALSTHLSRAMVTRLGRGLAPAALRFFPDSMEWIASATRIPAQAIAPIRPA